MHLFNRFGAFAIILCTIYIQGCATGAKSGAMTSALTEQTLISNESPLYQAISVGEISGGKKTNPAWGSRVSNEDFKKALEDSLKLHSMHIANEGAFLLKANLTELKQPFVGFDMTVTATTNYILIDQDKQTIVFSSEISTPYTAKVDDAFLGVKRLRLANEGAIKANISELLRQLINHFQINASTNENSQEDPWPN